MRRREVLKCTSCHLRFGIGGGRGPFELIGGDEEEVDVGDGERGGV